MFRKKRRGVRKKEREEGAEKTGKEKGEGGEGRGGKRKGDVSLGKQRCYRRKQRLPSR